MRARAKPRAACTREAASRPAGFFAMGNARRIGPCNVNVPASEKPSIAPPAARRCHGSAAHDAIAAPPADKRHIGNEVVRNTPDHRMIPTGHRRHDASPQRQGAPLMRLRARPAPIRASHILAAASDDIAGNMVCRYGQPTAVGALRLCDGSAMLCWPTEPSLGQDRANSFPQRWAYLNMTMGTTSLDSVSTTTAS